MREVRIWNGTPIPLAPHLGICQGVRFWLKEACEAQVPILYFLGIAPQRYLPLWPTYVADRLPGELKARLAFGMPAQRSVARIA